MAIADLWGLTEEQRLLVLGNPSRSTYHNWCKQAREHGAFTLDVDVLTRISAVLDIHQALGILFPSSGSASSGCEARITRSSLVDGRRSTSSPMALKMDCSRCDVVPDGARGGVYMQPNAIDEAFTPYDDTEIVSGDGRIGPSPRPAHRLIPSQFPPIGLFDTVDTTADLSAVMELAGWTNDRLVA